METLLVARQGGVVTVTMNRPEKKNAIDGPMMAELIEVFGEVERSAEDRALVLTGAGGDFCSGADLWGSGSPLAVGAKLPAMRRVGDVAVALHRLSKPTIAKVDGVAVGGGLSLALGCDLIVCSDRVRMSTVFSRRGLSLDYGSSWLLPRRVGMAMAKELGLLAEFFDGARAVEIGLANRVVPVAELDHFVDGWARALAGGPTLALSMTKTLVNDSWGASLAEAVEDEARVQAYNFMTEDTAEALRAFEEKRDPQFRGR